MKMKIALYHNLTSGGSKREAYEFAKKLGQHRHEVHLYTPSTANEQFLPLDGIVRQCFFYELHFIQPIRVRLPGLRKYIDLVNLIINLHRSKKVAQKIAADIDAGGYDFVFVHHDLIVQSPYLLRYLQTPSVYYCAEPMRRFFEPKLIRLYQQPQNLLGHIQHNWYVPVRRLSQNIIKTQDQSNIQSSTLLMTNSFFSAESIYRAYGLRARVVYLGVDVEKFRPLALPKSNFVLSVGAVSPLKCYDFIIHALGVMPATIRPRFLIVGNSASTGEQNLLVQLAQEKGVKLEIRVDVTDEELVALYNRALVFVYAPILEPFGLAPVEAMACGTPVVAVKEGGVRESVVDGATGFLVERLPQLFADALLDLLMDRAKQKQFGQNGREQVTQFWTWEKAWQRFQQVIEESIIKA
jgi:glycosyltransferase involved in cell wall biosynthesis